MPLPTKADVVTLDYVDWSLPRFQVDAKTFSGITISPNVYVNVSGTWKLADEVHVNVSGTWKRLDNDSMAVKVNTEWKQLTSGGSGSGITTSKGLEFIDWSLPKVGTPA